MPRKTFLKMCEKPDCDNQYETPWHLRKYCDEHFVGATDGRSNTVGDINRACRECSGPISRSKSKKAVYCGEKCRMKAKDRRDNEESRLKRNMIEAETGVPQSQAADRKGETYKRLIHPKNRLLMEGLLDRSIPLRVAAQRLGVTMATVSRSMIAVRTDHEFGKLKSQWKMSWRVSAMLPTEMMRKLKGMDPGDADFDETVDHLVRAYSAFSRYYFNLEGRRPLVKDFHLKWIRSIIVAYATGGKQLILSPPRHGKSEMLIRFVVWFIVMDPNIRIGWFCASSDVAKLMLGAVKDTLENNEQLVLDTLPPSETYKPENNSGRPWSSKELKVAQQTHVGAKSSSMIALGRTSKFLSRDMDVIIVDDMEDFDSTREEGQRIYSRNKLAEIGTRKVEETMELYIGSRQHPDDIPNHILDLEDTILQWKVIVDHAHDPECALDPEDYELHWDCMLFPEVRSYRYLMEKKLEMETLGLGHLYPLRYQNQAIAAEGHVFDMMEIEENALNKERGLGLEGLPLGFLAAGLDPSARGIQAGFLWHFTDKKLSMVDISTEQSGGQEGAVDLICDWYEKYGVILWYYESTGIQIDFYDWVKKEVAKRLPGAGIVIKDHNTGKNKKDAEFGISAMAPWYHSGIIDLPFGTNEARKKTKMLLAQLRLWTTDGVKNKHAKTDIKMASWFPFSYFRKKMQQERKKEVQLSDEAMYPGYGRMQGIPWKQTSYPGR